MSSCAPPQDSQQEEAPEPSQLSELSFEQRMEIRARLTVIRSEAKEEAALRHDRFTSKEAAIAYERLVETLTQSARDEIMAEYGLTSTDLERIVQEYLDSQGVEIRSR